MSPFSSSKGDSDRLWPGVRIKESPWWLTLAISNTVGPGKHDECRRQRIADGSRGTSIQRREVARSDGTLIRG